MARSGPRAWPDPLALMVLPALRVWLGRQVLKVLRVWRGQLDRQGLMAQLVLREAWGRPGLPGLRGRPVLSASAAPS